MIRLLLIATVCLFALPLGAQQLLDDAYASLKSSDFTQARKLIEQAREDQSLAAEPRTWFLSGFIYKGMYEQAADIYPESREVAIASFASCVGMSDDNPFREDCMNMHDFMLTTYFNDGVNAFNQQDFETANDFFSTYIDKQIPQKGGETYGNALFYGGLSAEYTGHNEQAINRYEQALSFNLQEPSLYAQLAYLYEGARDQANAVRVLDAGADRFPEDPDLMIARVNIFLSFEKYLAAEPVVEEYLQLFPDDKEVLLVAGTVYQHNMVQSPGSKEIYIEKSRKVYSQVLTGDPENYLANYNLGILLFNQAVDLIKLQEYDITLMSLDEVMSKSNALFQEALPYVEKANMMKPNNKNALFALAGIYYSMNDTDRLGEIERKLELLN